MKGRMFGIVLMGWLLALSPVYARAQAPSGATSEVKSVLDRAMEIQTRESLQGDAHRKERADLIRKLISEDFLAGEMAKETIQGQWGKLSPKQMSEFQTLFTTLFQDSYTRMVLNFLQKENIEFRGEKQDGEPMRVETVIMRTNEHIPVDYLVVRKGSRWLIRDVVIDGVSIVDNYKETFGRVIKTSSFESLLEKLRVQSKAVRDDA